MDKALLGMIIWGGITAFFLVVALWTFFVRTVKNADGIYVPIIIVGIITGIVAFFCLGTYLGR